jgi:hypothetical protein
LSQVSSSKLFYGGSPRLSAFLCLEKHLEF